MIDLHTHSTVSDGHGSPAQVMREAAAAGVDTVALTDHDQIIGWDEAAAEAAQVGVSLVRGAEISTLTDGVSVHLLGYLFRPAESALLEFLEGTREARLNRARKMADLLSRDFPVDWELVQAQAGEGTTLGRPHLADALVAAGVVASRDEAFATILNPSNKYYVRHAAPATALAVRAVIEAGGVPVLAHPFAVQRGRTLDEAAIERLHAVGLMGLEAYHRDHTPQQVEQLRGIARRLGLLVTGSSDYHGTGKPNRLGEHYTSPEVLAEIADRGALPILRP
ncbi:MAG: PHP domain-containing protein [Promicromonosporaceae bacterium]|nr:PHP domain-containing protein [Promicromonosporaceae bacterium]